MPGKEKFSWDEIFKAVRLCRELAGNSEPTRLAVEDALGGGDTNRITVAIRAVEAEYGHRPENLDLLPENIKRFVADPRKAGGRLPIPENLKAKLREPFLSSLIAIAGGVLQELEDAGNHAAILVASNELEWRVRLEAAEKIVQEQRVTIAGKDSDIRRLETQLQKATKRADRAEAAREAYVVSSEAITGMQTQIDEVHGAVVTKRAHSRRARTTTRRVKASTK